MTVDLGSSSQEWRDIYIDGTAYLDAINFNGTAITSTAAELNIVDGGTSATSTTVADADRVVLNDNGTMVQVAVTDLNKDVDDEITAMPNNICRNSNNSYSRQCYINGNYNAGHTDVLTYNCGRWYYQ